MQTLMPHTKSSLMRVSNFVSLASIYIFALNAHGNQCTSAQVMVSLMLKHVLKPMWYAQHPLSTTSTCFGMHLYTGIPMSRRIFVRKWSPSPRSRCLRLQWRFFVVGRLALVRVECLWCTLLESVGVLAWHYVLYLVTPLMVDVYRLEMVIFHVSSKERSFLSHVDHWYPAWFFGGIYQGSNIGKHWGKGCFTGVDEF